MSRRAWCFQHEPFEGPGIIAAWLHARGFELSFTHLYAGDPLPDLEGIDFLVLMGGSMSVNDEDRLPWLRLEKAFLRDYIRSGKPALGICLGAQLLANALGARVGPNRWPEIGWFDIEAVTPPRSDVFSLPERIKVFHWHGETFDIPDGAVRLARSEACENQAFQFGRSVIGLQFHLEMGPEAVDALVENCPQDLKDSPWVQSPEQLRAVSTEDFQRTNRLMGDLLKYLTGVT